MRFFKRREKSKRWKRKREKIKRKNITCNLKKKEKNEK